MFEFLGNTLKIFLGFIFGIPLIGVVVFCTIVPYVEFCLSMGGEAGIVLGILLLISMGFAWLIR